MPSAFQPFSSGFSSWKPPAGARRNDLTAGNLPYNLWGAAATNSANKAFGNNNPIQSWTLPGYTQSFNGLTGQATSKQTPSWDGNNAYMPISQRAGPISWDSTGWDGQKYSGQQGWQQLANQRDAFAGGLIQRLGEYQSGRQSGKPTFDFQSILNQANESLKNGTWKNPFIDPRAQNVQPTMNDRSYNPGQTHADQPPNVPPTGLDHYYPIYTWQRARAQPIVSQSVGQPYNPGAAAPSLPDIPAGWNDMVPEVARPAGMDPSVAQAGFRAGWRKEYEGPGWMSPDGRYWDGSRAAPWAQSR